MRDVTSWELHSPVFSSLPSVAHILNARAPFAVYHEIAVEVQMLRRALVAVCDVVFLAYLGAFCEERWTFLDDQQKIQRPETVLVPVALRYRARRRLTRGCVALEAGLCGRH